MNWESLPINKAAADLRLLRPLSDVLLSCCNKKKSGGRDIREGSPVGSQEKKARNFYFYFKLVRETVDCTEKRKFILP